MLSVKPTTPTTWTGNLSIAHALMVPSTAAAPDISHFMSIMASQGLMPSPPESKVMPFPTSTVGLPDDFLYSIMTMRASWALPLFTARSPLHPIFLSADLSKTLTVSLCCLAMLRAVSARTSEFLSEGGVLTRSRTQLTDSHTLLATSIPRFKSGNALLSSSTSQSFLISFFGLSDALYLSKVYMPSNADSARIWHISSRDDSPKARVCRSVL